MLTKLSHTWEQTKSSFWFVPALVVLSAFALALLLIYLDSTNVLSQQFESSVLFSARPDGSRGLLEAVAGSMITVAGVVYSITIVALSLAASQYTSRVLRNFIRDRINQLVLGTFLGIYVYCLVVLRAVQGGADAFVPALAVFTALLLALVGIGLLIYFIHHVATSIQVSSILASAAKETTAAIDQLFPAELGDESDETEVQREELIAKFAWKAVPARATGYLVAVDEDELLQFAHTSDTIVRMNYGVGEFVVEGQPIVFFSGGKAASAEDIKKIQKIFLLNHQRTLEQDAAFGIRQIVDIALRALSPGTNDTTTAVMCVQHLGALFMRLVVRRFPGSQRLFRGQVRVIAKGPTFAALFSLAFDQIRENAKGNSALQDSLLLVLEQIAEVTSNESRRALVLTNIQAISNLKRIAA